MPFSCGACTRMRVGAVITCVLSILCPLAFPSASCACRSCVRLGGRELRPHFDHAQPKRKLHLKTLGALRIACSFADVACSFSSEVETVAVRQRRALFDAFAHVCVCVLSACLLRTLRTPNALAYLVFV